VTVTGTGGGATHVANVILVINPAAQTSAASATSSLVTQSSSTQSLNVPGPNDIMNALQSNMLLVLGAIIVILLLAILAVLVRRKGGGTTTAQTTKPGTIYCQKCGTANTGTSQFCSKCGAGLGGKP
jgi:hypothetical protein